MTTPLIGVSPEIEKIRDLIDHIADTDCNVTITGETGVGKEVVARTLYNKSPRRDKPFVKVNCAAVPEGLLESEMYGHEPGAFTNATKKHKGKFELADEGVLFLDEIGDMSMTLQAKLLHALQTGQFAPIGAEFELKTNTWIIAATNHNLLEAIDNKTFRADLYYRLNIINIHIPPLKDRPEDTRHLINYYVSVFTSQYKNKKLYIPDQKTINKLIDFHWPGNVRQLQTFLKRLLLLGNNYDSIDELLTKDSEYASDTSGNGKPKKPAVKANGLFEILGHTDPDLSNFSLKDIRKKALDRVDYEAIAYTLSATDWNRTKAAKILKVSYKTLLTKINELGIIPP